MTIRTVPLVKGLASTLALASLVATVVACSSDPPAKHPQGPSTVPANRPTTSQGLSNAVFAALRANDQQAMVDVLVTVFDIGRTCPKMNQKFLKRRDKLIADTRAHFAECQTMLDWSNAAIVSVTGGDPAKPSDECPDSKPLNDIFITVSSGAKVIEVKLDDPVAINEAVLVSEEGPRCSLAQAPPAAAAPPAPAGTSAVQ